jgi:hypothetical protein
MMKRIDDVAVKVGGKVVGYINPSEALPDFWHWRLADDPRISGGCPGKDNAKKSVLRGYQREQKKGK